MGKGLSWGTWAAGLAAGTASALATQQIAAGEVGGNDSDPTFTVAITIAACAKAIELLANGYTFYQNPGERCQIAANTAMSMVTTALGAATGVLAGLCGTAARCFFTGKATGTMAGMAVATIGHSFWICRCQGDPRTVYEAISTASSTARTPTNKSNR